LAQLSIISGRFNDCSAHLNIISYILDPRNGNQQTPVSSENKDDISDSPSQLNPSLSDDSDGSDFIRSRMMTLDYRTVGDVSGSPTRTRHIAVKLPITWTHTVGCECDQCNDPVLENIWLSCYVIGALVRLRQGQTSEAEKMLSAACQQSNRVIANAISFLKELNPKKRVRECEASAGSIFQAVFSEINVRLCELALTKAEDVGQFSSLYARALDFIKQNYVSLASSYLHLTELYYFSSMLSLTWPSAVNTLEDNKITAVDMLCAGIGRMKTADVLTPPLSKRVGRKISIETKNDSEHLANESNVRSGRPGKKKTIVVAVAAAPVKKRPTASRLGAQRAAVNMDMMEVPRMSVLTAVKNELVTCKLPFSQASAGDALSGRSNDVCGKLPCLSFTDNHVLVLVLLFVIYRWRHTVL